MTIRQAVPFVWKYLALVMTSCALAFVISSEGRAAEPPAVKQASLSSALAGEGAYAGDMVTSVEETWMDAKRMREVPVRIVAPKLDAVAATRLPVIVFSHGLGGNRMGGKTWGEHWASHGYIVVHVQHPGSDEGIWRGKRGTEVETSLKSAMSLNNLGLRIGDVHFVIDEVIARHRAGSGVFRVANIERIGMSGHSFGAQTTLAIAGQKSPAVSGQSGLDTRVKAALAFSPNARNKTRMEQQFGDIRLPFMSITGTEDAAVLNDGTTVDDRTKPFQFMPAGGKYLLVFEGGDHMVFGGHIMGRKRTNPARDAEIIEDVKAATLAFWNASLKDDTRSREWLAKRDTKDSLLAVLAAKDTLEMK
jgi:dienelactone hydrolase